MSEFVMGARLEMTDAFRSPMSDAAKATEEFKRTTESTNNAVGSFVNTTTASTQATQQFTDALQETASAVQDTNDATQEATGNINSWKAAIQQFNRGTENLKNLPNTIRQIARSRLDSLETSFIGTRLQAGLLVGSIKSIAKTKISNAVNSFKEFKNTVTEGKSGLAGITTGIKNVGKISIANTYNTMKNLTSKFKEFAGTKISNVANKLKEFKNNATGGETGVKGLWNALKKAASVSFSAVHSGISKVGSLAATAGSKVAKGFGGLAMGTVKGLGVATGALAAGTAAAAAGIYKLAKMASDLSESENVVSATFGEDSVAGMKKWAQGMADAAGISETSATTWVGSMGAMLKTSGIAQKELPGMSQSLVKLSGDLASFYNLDNEEAWNKIRSGISGETEPLKQLGINMSVANLEAYALSKGITKSYNAMSQAEQTQLRYNYLMGVTADAQGDFAKTLDSSLSNQLRVLGLNFKTAGTNLGKIFMPAVLGGAKALNGFLKEANAVLVDGWQDGDADKLAKIFTTMLDTGVKALEKGLPNVVNTMVPIINTFAGALLKALPAVVPVLLKGSIQVFTSLIDLIKSNTQPLVSLAVSIVTNLASFLIDAIPEIVLVGASMILGFVQGLAKQLPQIVPQAVRAIENLVSGLMSNIDAIVLAGIDILNGLISGLVQNLPLLLGAAMRLILSVVTGLLNNIQLIINCALNLVQALVTGLIQNIPLLLQGALQLIMGIVNGLVSNIQLIIDGAIALVNALVTGIVQNLPMIVQAAVQVVIALALGLIQAIPQLVEAVPQLVFGIIDVILSTDWLAVGWEIVKGIGKGLFDGIKNFFGGGEKGGQEAAQGAATGLTNNMGTVNAASQATADTLTNGLKPDYTAINGYGAVASTSLAEGFTANSATAIEAASNSGLNAMTGLAQSFTANSTVAVDAASTTGLNVMTGLSTGLTNNIGLTNSAATEVTTDITNTFNDIDLFDSGKNAMEGLNNGLLSMRSTLMTTARGMANSIRNEINSALDIHSPSRVMEESGEFTGEGLILGINKMINKVKEAARGLSDSTLEPFATSSASQNVISPTGSVATPTTKKDGLRIQIENIILSDVGNKDPKELVAEILKMLYEALSGADEVLSAGEMEALLT